MIDALPPTPATTETLQARATKPGRHGLAVTLSTLFIGVLALILTSFPARNPDVWGHLAAGRSWLTSSGSFSSTGLFDVLTYGVVSVLGTTGLAATKAFAAAGVAVLMFRLALTSAWRVALVVTGLAVLAVSSWFTLQPVAASLVCLTVLMVLLMRRTRLAHPSWWPGWRLVLLFVLWANLDDRVGFGLLVAGLFEIGRIADARFQSGWSRKLAHGLGAWAILVLASCVNVRTLAELRLSPEWLAGDQSPFDPNYLAAFATHSSALAYFPLLALGVISFALNWRNLCWAWLLPWGVLAVWSASRVDGVPFYAIVAGPITAWNLQAYFARKSATRTQVRGAGLATVMVALGFLVAAWPGWLQGPPYEPRRWAVDVPPAFLEAAEMLTRLPADSRTWHVSLDTAGAMAWFVPANVAVYDAGIARQFLTLTTSATARDRLRERRVSRVVIWAADSHPISQLLLDRLLSLPAEWPVLSISDGLVIFGWRHPARTPESHDSQVTGEFDFNRLAYQPPADKTAPGSSESGEAEEWWRVFYRRAPTPHPPARDEARVLLRRAELSLPGAAFNHLVSWEASQIASLASGAAGWVWPAGPTVGAFRLTLATPPLPEPTARPSPTTELAFALQQRFAFQRGDISVGDVYTAIRAARRAVAQNPNDAESHLLLAQAARLLTDGTAERNWADQVPQIKRVRQVQASAALNRAVQMQPRSGVAHRELARLYRAIGCLDLAADHLRRYTELPTIWGGPVPGSPTASQVNSELEQLEKAVAARRETFAAESASTSVSDRALLAVQLELGGVARDLLLKSDLAAFGIRGLELEIDLLLRTGRPADVIEWLTPEIRNSLGELKFHWSRAQAHLALGNYNEADAEIQNMIESGGGLPGPAVVAGEIAVSLGRNILDEMPGPAPFAATITRIQSREEFQTRVIDVQNRLGRVLDISALRGVVALEAGNIAQAQSAFQSVTAHGTANAPFTHQVLGRIATP